MKSLEIKVGTVYYDYHLLADATVVDVLNDAVLVQKVGAPLGEGFHLRWAPSLRETLLFAERVAIRKRIERAMTPEALTTAVRKWSDSDKAALALSPHVVDVVLHSVLDALFEDERVRYELEDEPA